MNYLSVEIIRETSSGLPPTAQDLIRPFTAIGLENSPVEVYELERQSRVVKLLRSFYTPVVSNTDKYILGNVDTDLPRPQHFGSQFARRVMPALVDIDFEEGLDKFRGLSGTTTDEQSVLQTSDDQLRRVHQAVNSYLLTNDQEIRMTVSERFATYTQNGHVNSSAFRNNDRYQFSDKETTRSLKNIVENGIIISFDRTGIPLLQKAAGTMNQGNIIIDKVKNWPILTINGFNYSKLSLAVHDAIDHAWTFALADRLGLLNKFDELFHSIGRPQQTDIFKREGEMIASIAFGMRYWENQEGFTPILPLWFIDDALKGMEDGGLIMKRHNEALAIVSTLQQDSNSSEAQSLGFVLSNYITTLHEQRRRYGRIWQRDRTTNSITGELNPLGPDYLCFLIELHHSMFNNGYRHLDSLLSAHELLENYLDEIASGRHGPESQLRIDIKDMLEDDHGKESSGGEKVFWMARNYKFSSIKEEIRQ